MSSTLTPAREHRHPWTLDRSGRLQQAIATTTDSGRPSPRPDAGSQSGLIDDAISPAARAILNGSLFGRANGAEVVKARYPSTHGVMADVLIIRRHGDETDAHRQSLRAVQVRDLERMIAADEIVFIFGPGALDMNRAWGWGVGTTKNGSVRRASEVRA